MGCLFVRIDACCTCGLAGMAVASPGSPISLIAQAAGRQPTLPVACQVQPAAKQPLCCSSAATACRATPLCGSQTNEPAAVLRLHRHIGRRSWWGPRVGHAAKVSARPVSFHLPLFCSLNNCRLQLCSTSGSSNACPAPAALLATDFVFGGATLASRPCQLSLPLPLLLFNSLFDAPCCYIVAV